MTFRGTNILAQDPLANIMGTNTTTMDQIMGTQIEVGGVIGIDLEKDLMTDIIGDHKGN